MVQFYFLSVLLNILAGIILINSNNSTKLESDNFDIDDADEKSRIKKVKSTLKNDSILSNETFCLVTGALCTLTGFIKLFFTFSNNGKNIIIIGDLLPALFGLAGGLIIILEYYANSFAEHDLPEFIETGFFKNKKYFGIVCIIAGILHFAIPGFVVF